MKNKRLYLLCAVIAQIVVLVGMVTVSAMPLWTGEEIKIKTIPVDPRSLFRGNYALLRYDISEVKLSDSALSEKDIRQGEVVYVSLSVDDDGYYQFENASLEKPSRGVFLRGRIQERRFYSPQQTVTVKYGIEAFFAPKVKALALEDELRDGGVAVLMVSSNGKARIKEVIGE